MRHLLLIAFVVALALSGPAAAAKQTGRSQIAIATLGGSPYVGQEPAYRDTVTFTTAVEKLQGSQTPLIVVSCYQDVNGDGTVDTNLLGPDIVYSWVDHPDATFSFSGQGQTSIWSHRGGGAAICRAELDAYGWKQGNETIQLLASTGDFQVSG